jgi:hypothetical protein
VRLAARPRGAAARRAALPVPPARLTLVPAARSVRGSLATDLSDHVAVKDGKARARRQHRGADARRMRRRARRSRGGPRCRATPRCRR